MNRIKAEVDRIVARLKENSALSGIRFVREYSSNQLESPIDGWLAAVCITDVKLSKSYVGGYMSSSLRGEVYSAGVEIRLFAPAEENGSGLSELAGEIISTLSEAKNELNISSVTASAIGFDPNSDAVYRTVSCKLEFCASGEAV
jgi:hypothetical protein